MTFTQTQAQKDKMLLDALDDGSVEKIEKALKAGANPETRDSSGCTPLNRALMNADQKLCTLLLDAGADPNEKGALKIPFLIGMIAEGNTPMRDALFEAGADIHAVDEHGNTALHHSGRRGNIEFCKKLLAAGAYVDARNKSGDTPLLDAAIHNRAEVCEVLLGAGADVRAINTLGKNSALGQVGYDITRNTLLRAGAEPTELFKDSYKTMGISARIYFSPYNCPDAKWCIQNNQITNHVIDACVTGQFDTLIASPLRKSGKPADLQLFVDIWDRLPDWCQQKNQGIYIDYIKRAKEIMPPSIPPLEEGRQR